MKKHMKKLLGIEGGITRIALVISIIVLLILAGVSIAMLTGQNGILTQAQNAKNKTEEAQADEESKLESYEQYIKGSTNGGTLITVTGNETTNTTVYDSLGNKIVVPAGFKVINPGDNVEDGIIIEDVSAKDDITKGSQFVWIPTGTIHRKDKEDVTINLDRYIFASNGEATAQGNNEISELINEENGEEYLCQELASSSYANTTAINIDDFLTKAAPNASGGFYIGRYEARDGVATSERTDSTNDENQVVTKAENFIYNYVTQPQAATLSRNMYTSSNFTSDLINSYAWDTTLVFIQSCSGDNRYSQQLSLNKNFEPKGTVGLETTEDLECNIYDIASNCVEWSTETCESKPYPCTLRGGVSGNSKFIASTRDAHYTSFSSKKHSFRPILYL